ncbi:MAG: dihydropteroate synthase [Bryobacteraceae bacterium]|nr:dihydropteroate synthase [Bryobacteraceae bacterium]MDW8379806.1 dihydropteroate synthase [Bryobacterales bacterium]
MMRKRFLWKLRDSEIILGDRTLLVGILNVTPDSFSDGGRYQDPDRAYARALELEALGADILDIGAESTRPGSERISESEEIRRLIPVLKKLRGKLSIPISVDTYKSGVAARALDLGVAIINDPSGLTFDPQLAKVVAQAGAGLVLNHMRGTPETWARLPSLKNPTSAVCGDLAASVHRATRFHVDRARLVVDPGLGFGKRKEENSRLIAELPELSKELDLPVMVGPSRKSFLRQETDIETTFATAAAVAASILRGAHLVRVHDVKEMLAVIRVADQILMAQPEKIFEEPAPYRKVPSREPLRVKGRKASPREQSPAEPAQAVPPRPVVAPVTKTAAPAGPAMKVLKVPRAQKKAAPSLETTSEVVETAEASTRAAQSEKSEKEERAVPSGGWGPVRRPSVPTSAGLQTGPDSTYEDRSAEAKETSIASEEAPVSES